jgi:D-lactate dehydrogenase
MSTIAFLDVDPSDVNRVANAFPEAQLLTADASAGELAHVEVLAPFITTQVDRTLLDQLPSLKLLCTRSAGTDHLDLATCRERGITVCSVPDYGPHVIAEHAFALLLSAVRHIPAGHERVKGGSFSWRGLQGIALRGKTFGVVGTGRIGQAAAHIAAGFGMRVIAFDVFQNADLPYVSWEELWQQADVVSLHAPLLPSTQGMVNATTLQHCKPGVIIVNTARGGLMDEAALLEALDAGRVRLALLDALVDEKNLSQQQRLVQHPRVVVTPHIAFYADDSIARMYDVTIQSIREWQAGQTPTHAVR